jgi:hypothetical protein
MAIDIRRAVGKRCMIEMIWNGGAKVKHGDVLNDHERALGSGKQIFPLRASAAPVKMTTGIDQRFFRK